MYGSSLREMMIIVINRGGGGGGGGAFVVCVGKRGGDSVGWPGEVGEDCIVELDGGEWSFRCIYVAIFFIFFRG